MSTERWTTEGKDGKMYCFERKNKKTRRISCKAEAPPKAMKPSKKPSKNHAITKKKKKKKQQQQQQQPKASSTKKQKINTNKKKPAKEEPEEPELDLVQMLALQNAQKKQSSVTPDTIPKHGKFYDKEEWEIMGYKSWAGDSYFQKFPNLFDKKTNKYIGPMETKNSDVFINLTFEVEEIDEEYKYVVSWDLEAKSKQAVAIWLKTITPAGSDHKHVF